MYDSMLRPSFSSSAPSICPNGGRPPDAFRPLLPFSLLVRGRLSGHAHRHHHLGRVTGSMDRHQRSPFSSPFDVNADADYADFDDGDRLLECPFGKIECLGRSDVREAAYELLFLSCRSSPGFGGSKSSLNNHQSDGGSGAGEGLPKTGMGMTVPHSKIKKALGLRARQSSQMLTDSPGKTKRPMTSAEIMRKQMHITEDSDDRLRKALARTFSGNMTRRVETITLPLELLRQLKPSEFGSPREYHQWQRRQLKILEAGLLHHPALPIDWQNPASFCLLEVIRASEMKPLDTTKNSDAMRILCGAVLALAWRGSNGPATDGCCHWADGYPVNVNLYLDLLRSIFDLQEETVVLDEIDELLELMKKTWSPLGMNRMIHNVCFAWVLFQQYVETGQIEPDLISATVTMLAEVAKDARLPPSERDANYVNLLFNVLTVMQGWAERKMLDYHDKFNRGTIANMENILALAISTLKIVGEDLTSNGTSNADDDSASKSISRVDYYIKSSMRSAFSRLLENGVGRNVAAKAEDEPTGILLHLGKATEELTMFEKEAFSPIMKKWHPTPAAAAATTIHECFGFVMRQYLAKVTAVSEELIRVLISAGRLEKLLVRMAVEDSEDNGKAVMRELVPYEVDSLVGNLIAGWIRERLGIGKDCVERAKEEESWMPKSKNEPYADSALDLMKLAKVTVDEFFEIPLGTRDNFVQAISDGLEALFQDYVAFTSACGTKQSYLPSLPPLTRCNQESRFVKLWKRSGCRSGGGAVSGRLHTLSARATTMDSRPSASRGTQRLYIRLNTLHYLLANIHALDRSLVFPRSGPSPGGRSSRHFEAARSAAQMAIQYVSEVAAYRLIFLDSRQLLYEGLYVNGVARSGIRPALRVLKENLALMGTILTDRAQPVAVKEVMRAVFEAFLMVLLAGGSERVFERDDYEFVLEDFHGLKGVFSGAGGEAQVPEEVVAQESEVAEGIVELMGLPTERLIKDFSTAAYEASGMGGVVVRGGKGGAARPKVPMPPTTGRWNQSDPNTVLRVLCYRNEGMANQFLKRTFELARRR